MAVLFLCSLPAHPDDGAQGWRHWKAFYAHISQDIMEAMMDQMVKKYPVDGVPTSLKDLGYIYAGLDDHWQNCSETCV